jgi:hypothetical protein
MAIDGDRDTGWVSGGHPPQWIEVDLGAATPISRITLVVDQSPAGHVVHRILGGPEADPTTELAVIDSDAGYGDVLEVTGEWTVRFLRVETVSSPSWVAWLEIEVA